MPEVPFRPMATKIAEATMRVIRVMPLTGFDPTIAMALAATVVKRKAMNVTTTHATAACQNVWITPNQKKIRTATREMAIIYVTCFIEISVCQRTVFLSSALPLSSF